MNFGSPKFFDYNYGSIELRVSALGLAYGDLNSCYGGSQTRPSEMESRSNSRVLWIYRYSEGYCQVMGGYYPVFRSPKPPFVRAPLTCQRKDGVLRCNGTEHCGED